MNNLMEAYLEALITGNRVACKEIVDKLSVQKVSILDLYEKIFKESLYEVGKLWEYNKISVAVEHLATAITEGLMNELFAELIAQKREGKKVIIACVEKEEHQVGGKMVADVFEKNGWDTFFLGANTPINELIEFCVSIKPDMIILSLTVYINISFLLKEIEAIQEKLDTPILIGGQALLHKGAEIAGKFNNVHYLSNLYDLDDYLKGRN